MQTAPQQGWSTLLEGSQYFLYRSVSHIPLSTLESFIQRMQACQNQHIAVPELVRMPDGEVYLRESRGQRSFEDFLQQRPTTSTKLFLIQQLVKLVRNLHTFVGTEHGDLHIECLSIGLDDELMLGGIAPISSADNVDLDSVRVIIRTILSNPHEQELCKELCSLNLSRINQRIKRELATGNWDELLSDWTETVNNTTYEEPSDELSIEEPVLDATPSEMPSAEVTNDDSLWDFDDTEVVSASDFAELDDLDFLDDLNLDDLPSPSLIPSPSTDDSLEDLDPVFTDHQTEQEESDIEDLPSPSIVMISESSVEPSDVQESADDLDFDLENLMDNLDDDEDPFAIDALDEFDETEFFEIPSAQINVDDVEEKPTSSDDASLDEMNVPNVSKDDLTNNVFSQDSLLGTLDVPVSELENMIDEDEEELDWFSENTETMSEPIASATVEPSVVEPANGNETWVWAAGVAVVAGGVFAVLNRDTTPPPEVVIGNDNDNTEMVETEDAVEASTVATEPPVENNDVAQLTEDSPSKASPEAIQDKSNTVEPPVVESVKPVVAKSVATKEVSNTPKDSTPFKTTTTAKAAPVVKTVADLPPPKKKTPPSASRVAPVQSPVMTKSTVKAQTKPVQDTTPEVETVATQQTPVKPVPPVVVKTPIQKTEPIPVEQKPVVEQAKPAVSVEKQSPESGTQNLIADLAKPEAPSTDTTPPVEKPTVTAVEKESEPVPMLVQAKESTPEVTQEPKPVEPTVVEEPAVQPEPVVTTEAEPSVSEPEVTPEAITETPVAEVAVPSLDLNSLSTKAFSGKLSAEEMNQLLSTPQQSSDFTRANAIALTQAQRTNDVQRIGESLENLLSVDANTHKPVYLLAMAQYQFNTQNIDGARDYLLQAENNWQHIERDQLVILRAQRDNIVAHISYTTYLETGSEDSRLQSITQFRKVQREARRGKLTSMFERAEAKMQFLQRKAQ